METDIKTATENNKELPVGFNWKYNKPVDNSYLFFFILWIALFKSDLNPEECKKVLHGLEKIFDKDIENKMNKEKGEE